MIIVVQRRGERFEFELTMKPLPRLALQTHSLQAETQEELLRLMHRAADEISGILIMKLTERKLG